MTIGVIGAGAFGTALAISLSRNGTPVLLWGRSSGQVADMLQQRENHKYLPGVRFPDKLMPTDQLDALAGASCVLLVVPAQKTESFLERCAGTLRDTPMVLCAKGVDPRNLRLQSEICTGAKGVLSGPGFATEIAAGLPTALTLATEDGDAALQTLLSRPELRLYRTSDMIGVQLGGALKNVVAIAAGIAVGAGLGESARAAIMTRGFAEMRRLAARMGADDATLSGLSGLGDLSLTCASTKSRNFAHGHALGAGSRAAKVTVEGIATAKATIGLAERHDVEMPVAQAVASVLDGGASVPDAIGQLLARPLRAE